MLDRTVAPPSRLIDQISFAPYTRVKLGGSTPCIQIIDTSQPVVIVELIFRSGRVAERVPGVSWYASKLTLEGTKHRDSQELSTAIESLGSFLDISAGLDHVTFKLYALKKNISESLTLLEEVLTQPTFPEEGFLLQKEIRSRNIENILARNSQYANLAVSEKLFGPEHPYGRILTPGHVRQVKLDDVRNHFQTRLFTEPKVLLCGDFDHQVIRKLEDILSKLTAEEQIDTVALTNLTSGKFREDRQESTQASIRLASCTIDKQHPDIHDFMIANALLGGFFGSRLMKKIREEKGLTYGIYSMVSHMQEKAAWQINAEVQKEKAEEALEAIYAEINLLKKEAPSQQELNTLKNYLFGKIQSSMDSLFSIASMYKSLLIDNIEVDFIESYVEDIKKIQPGRISEMIENYVGEVEKVELIIS